MAYKNQAGFGHVPKSKVQTEYVISGSYQEQLKPKSLLKRQALTTALPASKCYATILPGIYLFFITYHYLTLFDTILHHHIHIYIYIFVEMVTRFHTIQHHSNTI